MKKIILSSIFVLTVVVLCRGQGTTNTLTPQEREAFRKYMEHSYPISEFAADEDVKDFAETGVTTECMYSVYIEAITNLLVKGFGSSIIKALLGYDKFMEELYDVNSQLYNEFLSELQTLAEKNCMEAPVTAVIRNGPAFAQIALLKYGQMYKIKVTLGSSTKYYLFDSGAAASFISKTYARELEDLNIIKANSYIEPTTYQLADGSEILCRRVLLSNVRVGDYVLDNVVFAIAPDDIEFIFGKNVLDAFHSWKINNSSNTLELTK